MSRTHAPTPEERPALTLDESIPHVCTVADLCRIFQVTRRTLYTWLKESALPFSEIKPRVGHPRWSGADVRLYLEGFYAERKDV
jgi:hypothetical protein